jgi:predicted nucleotidyltransferase
MRTKQIGKNSPLQMNDLLGPKRQLILNIAAQHGAKRVRVFGSVARGEARPDSDVDFLVDLEPGRSLFDLGGLLMELQDLLGRKVDVVTKDGLHWYIRDQVLKEAISL